MAAANMDVQAGDLWSRSGETIKNVEDIFYHSSWTDSSEGDIQVLKKAGLNRY
jgi:hypothetical protein